ncbi:MAG: prepilin-type N-terminal cleavage/methylation domain-containing protein [Syntrophaceae bacterium]|nr:prepilin-type N-terminal cleavage/methylation domain-containing protein [Syntrophaceae bacterium]
MPTRIFTKKQGFTLIEIVITIVILGAVAGILVPFFNAITHSPDPVIRERAISLGQAMMDEIIAKRWDENTPMGGGPICTGESPDLTTRPKLVDPACGISATPVASLGPDGAAPAETRVDFDDVDDYNGLNEVANFTDQNGIPFVLTGYTRQVAVRYIASNTNPIDQTTAVAASITDTKLVVVTITSPLGETFNFVAVACNI